MVEHVLLARTLSLHRSVTYLFIHCVLLLRTVRYVSQSLQFNVISLLTDQYNHYKAFHTCNSLVTTLRDAALGRSYYHTPHRTQLITC